MHGFSRFMEDHGMVYLKLFLIMKGCHDSIQTLLLQTVNFPFRFQNSEWKYPEIILLAGHEKLRKT